MRTVIVRIGATGAGALLALGLLAGPSAAKDSDQKSSAEKAREGNKVTCFQPDGETNTQGRSLSDPDGDTNGGADKPDPDCTGGVDATDRDGNNGCGNDADREDDNNGRCGRQKAERGRPDRPAATTTTSTSTTTSTTTTSTTSPVTVSAAGTMLQPAEAAMTTTTTPATVSAAGPSSPAGLEAASTTVLPQTEVLGETLSQPSILARTGAGVGGLALLGGLLCGGGRLALLARRFLRID
jgi:hypothetical protein